MSTYKTSQVEELSDIWQKTTGHQRYGSLTDGKVLLGHEGNNIGGFIRVTKNGEWVFDACIKS